MAWLIELRGDSTDLNMLAESMKQSSPCIEQEEGRYILRCEQLDDEGGRLQTPDAIARILHVLNGSARLVLGTRVAFTVGNVWQERDGSRSLHVFGVPATVHMRVVPVTITVGTRVFRPADPIPEWLSLAMQEACVRDALQILGKQEPTWVDLYKLYEIVNKDTGGIVNMEWATRNSVKRFTQTANSVDAIGLEHSRHGVPKGDPPSRPLSYGEARRQVELWVDEWIRPKLPTTETP